MESCSYDYNLTKDHVHWLKILWREKRWKARNGWQKIYRSLILLPHKLVTTQYGCSLYVLWEKDVSRSDKLDIPWICPSNKIFRQIIGIPMGCNTTPFFANLFLLYYHNKWMKKLKNLRAKTFANLFTFFDNLTTVRRVWAVSFLLKLNSKWKI